MAENEHKGIRNYALITLRKKTGLNAKQFSAKTGIKYLTYISYEHARHYPSIKIQKRIYNFFRSANINVSTQKLFPEELKNLMPKREYVSKKATPQPEFVSLSNINPKSLPIVNDLYEKVGTDVLKSKLDEFLSELRPREKEVIIMKFGLDDGREKTYAEIGKKFHRCRETMRKDLNKGLTRIYRYIRRKGYSFETA